MLIDYPFPKRIVLTKVKLIKAKICKKDHVYSMNWNNNSKYRIFISPNSKEIHFKCKILTLLTDDGSAQTPEWRCSARTRQCRNGGPSLS